MNRTEKQHYLDAPCIGYWSEYGGIELKEITYGINDYAVVVANAWSGNRNVHRVAIHYKEDDAYIIVGHRRYHFNECIRTEA